MTDTMTDALRRAREAIASLPEDALGMAQIGFGGPEDVYPIRDELLSEIDAALASTPTVADDGKLVDEDAAWLRDHIAHCRRMEYTKEEQILERIAARLEQPSGMREALEEVRNFAANRTNEAPGFGLIVRAIDHALSQQHKGEGGE
jgi:hypothetical protein